MLERFIDRCESLVGFPFGTKTDSEIVLVRGSSMDGSGRGFPVPGFEFMEA